MNRLLTGWIWLALVVSVRATETIAILPGTIALDGPEAQQPIVVERIVDGIYRGPVSTGLVLTPENPSICRVENDVVLPVAEGKTTLTAKIGDATAQVDVVVTAMSQEHPWSFRNHVQSVLAKAGCNSGACHGALAGKRGFKLSLRGYDAPGDYDAILQQAAGRRVHLEEPGKSLLLTKATSAVPHGGGQRFTTESREYRVLASWIAAGAIAPSESDARIQRIDILPAAVTLDPQATQPLLVMATFSDGRVEDVTRWAKFASAQADVVDVNDVGLAKVVGTGEGAVSAWYLNKIALATVTVPYASIVDSAVFAQSPRNNVIDELVLEKLAQLNLPPSGPASDEEYLRRVYLDTIGALPTAEEVRTFLADTSVDKRQAVFEKLLDRPEFVDYWTYKWCDLLLVNSERLRTTPMWAYYHWVRDRVSASVPWDVFVRELMTTQGSTFENGAANFYVLHQDTRELAETVSVAFMGLSINCARCHNHPLERWTNDEYFGFANLLSRVRLKGGTGDGHFIVYAAQEGDLVQPLRGKPQEPRPLDGSAVRLDAPEDRRIALAQWLTAPENPYFTRAIVNRVWANFMGVGLNEPVDDLRLTNPPSHPKLMQSLCDHLVAAKYDLKSLMRLIVSSAAYQRTSVPLPENAGDRRFYSRYFPRRLMAETLLDAIAQVTGVPDAYPGYPAGWRAVQLPDTKVASAFLDKFGRPKRDATCECERTNAPSVVQALHVSNGELLNEKLRHPSGNIERWMTSGMSADALMDEIYLTAASRRPSKAEQQSLVNEYQSTAPEDRRAFLEDLLWSIISSKEFQFHH